MPEGGQDDYILGRKVRGDIVEVAEEARKTNVAADKKAAEAQRAADKKAAEALKNYKPIGSIATGPVSEEERLRQLQRAAQDFNKKQGS